MENNQLTVLQSGAIISKAEYQAMLEEIQSFTGRMAKQPKKSQIKINEFAGNSRYLPIGHLEAMLDEYFFGLWQTKDFRYQMVANEIVGSIELSVYHPAAKIWITRTGAAAVMIQFEAKKDDKGNKIKSDIMDYRGKILNTLVKDFPHLKASCLSNAVKSLGKVFGRDLNRKEDAAYNPMLKMVKPEVKALKDKLESYTSPEALKTDFATMLAEFKALDTDLFEYATFTDELNAKYRALKGIVD